MKTKKLYYLVAFIFVCLMSKWATYYDVERIIEKSRLQSNDKVSAPIPNKKIPPVIKKPAKPTFPKVYLGMPLQRFLLSEKGQSAQRVYRDDKAQVKQEVWVYKDGTDEEQCFLFHDGILVDWQN